MLYRLSQNKFIPKLLIIAMLYISGLSTINAAVITSTDLVTQQQDQVDRDQLLQALEREDVQNALLAQGVDPQQAKQRVASMTAEEVQLLNQKMDELPAGAGVVEAILIVFLVLLITDLMGYTDVFPFVKKTVN